MTNWLVPDFVDLSPTTVSYLGWDEVMVEGRMVVIVLIS